MTGAVCGLAAVLVAACSTLVPADAPTGRLDVERATWRSLSPATHAHYCVELDRRDAVRAYADAIAEGEHPRGATRLARRILSEGCTP